jgi:hypothetical protein
MGDFIDTGEEKESMSVRPPTYPFTLVDMDGNKFIVIDTICMKFLSMHVRINGANPDVSDMKAKITAAKASCRIAMLQGDDGLPVIEIKDDIFNVKPYITKIKNINHAYTVYADAIAYARRLGYTDMFEKNRFSWILSIQEENKKNHFADFWERVKGDYK